MTKQMINLHSKNEGFQWISIVKALELQDSTVRVELSGAELGDADLKAPRAVPPRDGMTGWVQCASSHEPMALIFSYISIILFVKLVSKNYFVKFSLCVFQELFNSLHPLRCL